MSEAAVLAAALALAVVAVVTSTRAARPRVAAAIRSAALLLLLTLAWRSAAHLAYSAWDFPLVEWIWWPAVAGMVALLQLIRSLQVVATGSKRPSQRLDRLAFPAAVVALALFLALSWLVADSGPGLLLDPVQVDVGAPGGWVLVGGITLGREFWQPAFLLHIGSGAWLRIGYYSASGCLVSPPPLLAFAVAESEEWAVWMEPRQGLSPGAWFEATLHPEEGMEIVTGDLSDGRPRRRSPGIELASSDPQLAIADDGGRVALLEGDQLSWNDTATGRELGRLSLNDVPEVVGSFGAEFRFASADVVQMVLEVDRFRVGETGARLLILEADLVERTIAVTGAVDLTQPVSRQVQLSAGSKVLLVVDSGVREPLRVYDGRSGAALADGDVALPFLRQALGYDVDSFLRPAPSEVSYVPRPLERWLISTQLQLFRAI